MKTTLDLPAALVRAMKRRAVHEGRKLKDVAAELLERGLQAEPPREASPKKGEMRFPLFQCGSRALREASKCTAGDLA